ncbi:hypothetical protein J7413_14320 [Shimia sp. R10_1]|uniref:hypothetical protein n=1 Tax=Shimia sp. R10_1 TaxID=2821095 RepID=UPI001ADB025B|nr:hypothetical protein [Shimia sp. R10_1]MBO9474721.1 hypothetical protein [Shimia sp. R10_1]
MRHLIPALAAALLMAVFIAFDLARPLGAHPWWSQQTLLIGAPIGLILASLARLKLQPVAQIPAFGAATLLAFAAAKYGQLQFAASYAENQLAGQAWYFGWIFTAISGAALLTAIIDCFAPQSDSKSPAAKTR